MFDLFLTAKYFYEAHVYDEICFCLLVVGGMWLVGQGNVDLRFEIYD